MEGAGGARPSCRECGREFRATVTAGGRVDLERCADCHRDERRRAEVRHWRRERRRVLRAA